MMNQIMLVGRMSGDIEKLEKNGKEFSVFMLAVPRAFKNENGEYDKDILPITIWDGIAKQVSEYCRSGDTVGVRGRLQANDGAFEIIAEKVTFLSSRKDLPKTEEE